MDSSPSLVGDWLRALDPWGVGGRGADGEGSTASVSLKR